MKAFNRTAGVLIPLPQANLDTDRIIPKQYLTTVQRSGLGAYLFDEMRYHDHGFPGKQPQLREPQTAFVLNQAAYRHGKILVTGANFGCGSSREHAVWSLLDFGIEVVIAPSFADIFFTNCAKNGLFTVELTTPEVQQLLELAQEQPGSTAEVILASQEVIVADGTKYSFEIEPLRKQTFSEGLDEIAVSLQSAAKIKQFEHSHYTKQPWLKQGIA